MGHKAGKMGVRRTILRVIAVILVLALLSTALLVYRRADLSFSAAGIENRGAQIAAGQLMSENRYASASRIERMGAQAKRLLSAPSSYEDYEMASEMAVARGDYSAAADYTDRAIGLYEGDEAGAAALYFRMGYLETLRGDHRTALEWLNRGLGIADSAQARLTRAQVRLNLGDAPGALRDVEGYLNQAKDDASMLPYLVNVYEAAGEYETAAEIYTNLIDQTGDGEYLLNRAYCYTNLGRMADAAADCQAYAAAGGAQAGASDVMLGLGWMRQGDYREAGRCFASALESGDSDPDSLYYYVVLCAYIDQDYARVCDYGDRMIERARSGEALKSAQMDYEETTGKVTVSLAELDYASLCLMTGASHMQLGQYEQALGALSLSLEGTSDAAYASYLRASCLLALERYDEALADFDAAIAGGEQPERCRYGRGVCRMQLGDADGAMEDFDWVLLNGSDASLFEGASRLMAQLMAQQPSPESGESE